MKKIHLKNLRTVEVYVLIEDNFRKKLFDRLFNNFKRKQDTAKAIGVREGYSLTRYQKGLRFCPLSTLRKICNVLNYDLNNLEDNILEIKQGSSGKTGLAHGIKNPKFPYKESKELAYLIGKFIGDGHIGINKRGALQISYYNHNKILRNEFKKQTKSFFGNVSIKEINKNVVLPSVAGFILLEFCKDFKTFTSNVPLFIIQSKGFTKSFLRAIFEDEGCVSHRKHSRILIIGMSNITVISQIGKMLENLGINPNPIRKTKKVKSYFYEISITGRENLKRFYKEIGFTKGYYKDRKLEKAIKSYKLYQNRIGESRRLILDCLIKSNMPCSTKELCQQLSMGRTNLLQHLSKLEKQGKIKRTIRKPEQDKRGRLLGNFPNKWSIIK